MVDLGQQHEERQFAENSLHLVMHHVSGIDGIFREHERRQDGVRWIHTLYPLSVISSVSIESDTRLWLHVSLAHAKRLPNYDEITKVKKHFIGEDKYALMVFPPADKHVNLNPYCLHLWHCIGGHPLPEFSGMTPVGRSL